MFWRKKREKDKKKEADAFGFTSQEERFKALESLTFAASLAHANLPAYARTTPSNLLIQILCKGQCNSERWARLNKPHPGKSDLKNAKKGEYQATCLKCGYVAVDNHNWHRQVSEARALQALKSEIAGMPQKYSAGAVTFGAGASKAQEQIPTICAVIDDAINALETGLDTHNLPIKKSQIADGLKRLVAATRQPAFIGLVSTALTPTGVSELERYMNELEQIANKIL